MSYLLDTHVFLWVLFEPDKLSSKAKEILQNPSNHVALSVVSFWEISLKYALGKLELRNCTPEQLLKEAQRLSLEVLDLTASQATTFHHLPRAPHKDPFDRMIVWQAVQQRLILITRDRELDIYKQPGLQTLW